MADAHLHIVSFNVPYPPDYGGVIDVFHKITALHRLGVKVHLHCFQYGRNEAKELEQYCHEVHYYNRLPMWRGFFSSKPFLVVTRQSESLKNVLLRDEYPILFEGLHACYLLNDKQFKSRLKMVRMHNNEPLYYQTLSRREKNWFRKTYFAAEASRLNRFEQILSHAQKIWCIAPFEAEHYEKRFKQAAYLPAFHGHNAIDALPGKGEFILYHGNLAINENAEAARFILREIWDDMDAPLIIAGSNPSAELEAEIEKHTSVQLIKNPSHEQLQQLIRDAHIHLLPAMQQTGIKLKLLNALFNGRFVLTNRNMIEHTGLESYCLSFNTPEEAKAAIAEYMQLAFTTEDIAFRKPIENLFSDEAAAKMITQFMQE